MKWRNKWKARQKLERTRRRNAQRSKAGREGRERAQARAIEDALYNGEDDIWEARGSMAGRLSSHESNLSAFPRSDRSVTGEYKIKLTDIDLGDGVAHSDMAAAFAYALKGTPL